MARPDNAKFRINITALGTHIVDVWQENKFGVMCWINMDYDCTESEALDLMKNYNEKQDFKYYDSSGNETEL